MIIQNYISQISKKYQSGISKEHAYRTDLENLLRALAPEAEIINEPANVTDCGNPDFVITREKIPIGFIEVKDIGKDLNSKQYKEQFTRYRKAIDNLIISDYLWFRFFQNDKLVNEIRIAEIRNGKIIPLPESFGYFGNLITGFCMFAGQSITSAQKLAELMAGKARLLQNILGNAVTSDEQTSENTSLKGQIAAFRKVLIHDITPKEFADIYAQTLAYGMFAARVCDAPAANDFSRQKAAELIPQSNPFLRKLFQFVAGYDIDERIRPTVDNLADVFRAADMQAIMKNFGAASQQNDPVIHFYETFLAQYDPKLRKSRGVWFTPEPVVRFIVRAADDILKTDFGLAQGLADNSKINIRVNGQEPDKRSKTGYKQIEKTVHRVQILDPATGTGTFLAEVIRQIYHSRFKSMQGIWSSYVGNDLIPRLNGFELLMASYAMAHLKLDLLLRETGFNAEKAQRFHVYLTNSLEEHHPDTGTLFAQWLSDEANEANHIKRDTPVMVVMGNPPYSGHSANKGEWMEKLLKDYKQEPGGGKLQERNPKWLNDDYVKFIRYGQYFIEKNGEGILAYVNNHSFLDNPTFRGMRWHLLTTFDKIYILDLHGNSKKKETCPDGSPDKNVFDIQQGVSVNIFVKTGKKKKDELGKVFHADLFGDRDCKYDYLSKNTIETVKFKEIELHKPRYFFVRKDFEKKKEYDRGFSMVSLFPINGIGITTAHDAFVINDDKNLLFERYIDFKNSQPDADLLHSRFKVKKKKGWNILEGWTNLQHETDLIQFIKPIAYRPFDNKFIFYENKLVWRTVYKIMQHFLRGENVGLNWIRPMSSNYEFSIFISKFITDQCSAGNKSAGAGISYIAPLYLYPETNEQQSIETNEAPKRTPNLNMEIVQQIAEKIGLAFTPENPPFDSAQGEAGTFAPIDILDYIYAVLHSPAYRETYKEFLKIDFPRVPYPKDAGQFWQLVGFGKELREIHLLENLEGFGNLQGLAIATYPQDGDNIITRKISKKDFEITDKKNKIGRVWINDQQYFDNIPIIAWEFFIGGYQPAQKWLKDRHNRTLSFDDILHYQKIIAALTETDRIMKDIDIIKL